MPIPDAILPDDPDPEPCELWHLCPSCGSGGWLGHLAPGWEMRQVCAVCGFEGPELHFTRRGE